MNQFQQIIDAGLNRLSAIAGVDIRYTRGTDWIRIRATPGSTDFTLSDQFGAVSEYRTRDYIVSASSLVINGTLVKPIRGDTILEGSSVYEVSRPDGGEQPWSFSDHGGTHLRIHTKLVNS